MPYSPEHSQLSRQRILQAAARLFCSHGFDGVTLGQIMKQARMTHGAFYAYFSGKSALYAEALKFASSHAFWASSRIRKHTEDMNIKALVARYLGKAHADLQDCLSPMAFLVTDAHHKELAVRTAYQQCYFDLVDNLAAILHHKGMQDARDLAEEIIVRLVGTLTIAQSIPSKSTRSQFLKRARTRLIRYLDMQEQNGSDGYSSSPVVSSS